MIVCLLAFVGCQNEELVNETTDTGNGKKVTLTATIAGTTDSRVALNEVNEYDEEYAKNVPTIMVNWKVSDEKFTVYNADYSGKADFTQDSGNEFTSKDALPDGEKTAYYGRYTLSNGTLSYDLSAQDGTLNEDCILMQADMSQNSSKITFHHQTAILKPTFKVGDAYIYINNITKIVMRGVHAGFGKNSITVLRTGVPDEEKNNIYIFLPIGTDYYSGDTFNFTVTTADREEYAATLTIPEDKSIEAGMLYTAELSLDIPYVTFRAKSEQTLDLKRKIIVEEDEYYPQPYPGDDGYSGYIEYSVGDNDTWEKFTHDTTDDPVTFGGTNGDLRLRGKSPYGTLQAQIVFGNNTPVACSGDIRTLVDWENHETANTSSAIFQGLFKDCSVLTSAPELPATALAPNCYYSMFVGCTRLNAAPELPAITLAAYCYKSMFYDCTSLTAAPELPATSLAESCYGQMFAGCTNLAAAPELSATNLANDCYNGMFAGCSELASAPALPATKLETGCYNGMFRGCTLLVNAPALLATNLANDCYAGMFMNCTSLTSAPELPATTLNPGCYYQMFSGCTSLKSVTMLATDITATNCLTFWMDGVEGVATTGTFTKAASMTSLPTGANGIPSGWTVKNY